MQMYVISNDKRYPNFPELEDDPYPFLLFVSNMQSMKVDTQPRPSPSLLV